MLRSGALVAQEFDDGEQAWLDLAPDEAALMAAVVPSPVQLNIARPSAYVRERQRWIRRQMRQLGGRAYLNRM